MALVSARNLFRRPSFRPGYPVTGSLTIWAQGAGSSTHKVEADPTFPLENVMVFEQEIPGVPANNTTPGLGTSTSTRPWEPDQTFYFAGMFWMEDISNRHDIIVSIIPHTRWIWADGDSYGENAGQRLVVTGDETNPNGHWHFADGYITSAPSSYAWRDASGNPVQPGSNERIRVSISSTGPAGTKFRVGCARSDEGDTPLKGYFDGSGFEFGDDPGPEWTFEWNGTEHNSTSSGEGPPVGPPAQETSLSLDITPSEAVAGEPITLTANVTPVEAKGSVTFTMDGITSSVLVEDGQAVTEVTAFEAGDYEVVATFVPSGSEWLGSSATSSVLVDPPAPVVLTVGEPAEVNLWTAGGIDPSIRPAWYHEGLPPGMEVDEEVDSHILYGTPTEAGEFVVTLMGLDLYNNPYEVGTVTITVAEGEPDPAVETTTTLSVVPSEITEGESVSLTATVTPASAAGSVDFSVNGITSSAQVIGGVASSEVSIFEWGTYEVLAEFVPTDEDDFLPSSGTSSVNVLEYIPPIEPVETTTTLTVVPSTIYEGGSAVLTATVSPAQAQGTITFTLDGATDTIPVTGGQAAREVTVMQAGDYEVNATFAPVSEEHLPSSATPQILSVRPYVEPVDPEGPWGTWSALASNLAPKVAAYAGRPDHAETIEIAQAQLPVIAEYVRGHTRGKGFENIAPASPLLAVIVSACARLVTNPEQVQYYAVGDYSERPAQLAGWTLTELDVLRRYRRTQA